MELTKIEENTEVTSGKVLCWAKREAQGAQSAIMNRHNAIKLKIMKVTYKDGPRRPSVHIKMPIKQTCRYCGSSHSP